MQGLNNMYNQLLLISNFYSNEQTVHTMSQRQTPTVKVDLNPSKPEVQNGTEIRKTANNAGPKEGIKIKLIYF